MDELIVVSVVLIIEYVLHIVGMYELGELVVKPVVDELNPEVLFVKVVSDLLLQIVIVLVQNQHLVKLVIHIVVCDNPVVFILGGNMINIIIVAGQSLIFTAFGHEKVFTLLDVNESINIFNV